MGTYLSKSKFERSLKQEPADVARVLPYLSCGAIIQEIMRSLSMKEGTVIRMREMIRERYGSTMIAVMHLANHRTDLITDCPSYVKNVTLDSRGYERAVDVAHDAHLNGDVCLDSDHLTLLRYIALGKSPEQICAEALKCSANEMAATRNRFYKTLGVDAIDYPEGKQCAAVAQGIMFGFLDDADVRKIVKAAPKVHKKSANRGVPDKKATPAYIRRWTEKIREGWSRRTHLIRAGYPEDSEELNEEWTAPVVSTNTLDFCMCEDD